MPSDPRELLRQIEDVGVGIAKKYESDRAVKLVKGLVSSIEKTINALDKYLKKGKDALEKGKEIAENKGKGLVDLAKSKFAEVKDTGLIATAKKTAQDTTGKFKDMFASDTEKANGPPAEQTDPTSGETAAKPKSLKDKAINAVKGAVAKLSPKTPVEEAVTQPQATDTDALPAKGPDVVKPTTVIGKMGKLLGGAKDKAGKLAEDAKASGPFNSLIAAMSGLKSSIVTLTKANKKTAKPADAPAPTGEAKPNRLIEAFKKQKERMFGRQKEVDDEKSGAKTKDKPKAKGPLGMIISAIGALGGVFTSVIGKGIGKLLMFLPKMMLKGMGGLLTRLIPSLAGLIAPGAASAIGSVAGGIATTVGGAVLSGLGSAAVAVGTAIVSPIGLGIIAVGVTAYAGYKLYKYLNRNNTGSGLSGKLTNLRLLSYGYNDVVKEHYNKVLDMDMLVKDYVSNKDGQAVYKKFDSKFKKAILEIFSIGRDSTYSYKLLNEWFIKRYVPSHAAFMNAYYGAGGKDYIDDLDKLTPEQTLKFISSYRLQPEVFDQKSIPVFEAPDCTVRKEDVDALIVEITKEAKEGFDKDKDKKAGVATKKPTRAEENKAYTKAGVDASDKKFNKTKELAEAAKDIPGAVDPSDRKFLTPKEPTAPTEGLPDPSDKKFLKGKEPLTGNEEGEKPPPASTEKAAAEEKPLQSTVDKVTKAPGPLKQGGTDLVGIKSKVATEKIQNLDPNVLNLLSGMTKEYSELTGKSITVNEAFRTRQDQERMKASKGAAAAAPGTSLHEFGIAVDISSADADTLDKMGLMRKYGFTRPIGGETWHIEPAGVSLNPGGSKSDPQERMKNILSSPGRGGGGLGANRRLPSSMKYKRDMALQKTLFNSGTSIESPVEVADLKKDQGTAVATGPIIDSKPVKDPAAGGMMKTSAAASDPTKMLQPKQEGLDAPKVSKPAEGPQLTNALYRPPVQDKKIYSDYSEGEKPPKEGANKSTDDANASLGPKEAILKASQIVGVDYNKLLTFAKLESSLKSGVQSAASTATGLFQIVGKTWADLLKRFGPKYNIPADAQPTNAYYNSVLGACYAKENMGKMDKYKDSGISENILTYLAHHFGPEGGERIVKAYMKNPDSPMQMNVSEDAYKSNVQVLANKTVRQYIDSLTAKFSKAGATEYGDKAKTPQASGASTPAPKETYTGKSPAGFGPYDKANAAPLPVEKYVSKGLNFSDTTSAEKNDMDAKLAAVRQKQALAAQNVQDTSAKTKSDFIIDNSGTEIDPVTGKKGYTLRKQFSLTDGPRETPELYDKSTGLRTKAGEDASNARIAEMQAKADKWKKDNPEQYKKERDASRGRKPAWMSDEAWAKTQAEDAKIDAEDAAAEAAAKAKLPVKQMAVKTSSTKLPVQELVAKTPPELYDRSTGLRTKAGEDASNARIAEMQAKADKWKKDNPEEYKKQREASKGRKPAWMSDAAWAETQAEDAKIDAEDAAAEAAAKAKLPVKQMAAKAADNSTGLRTKAEEDTLDARLASIKAMTDKFKKENPEQYKKDRAASARKPAWMTDEAWAETQAEDAKIDAEDAAAEAAATKTTLPVKDLVAKTEPKFYGDDYDYSGGQARTAGTMSVEQTVNKPDYPMTVSKQPTQRAGGNFGNSILDKLNAKLNTRANGALGGINGAIGNATGQVNGMMGGINGAINNVTSQVNKPISGINAAIGNATGQVNGIVGGINGAIGNITNQINKPINDISGAISNTANQVNGVVGGINGVFNNISKGINDTTSIFSKGMNPGSMMEAARQVVPQQPSAAMSLDKTESLLTNMGDTLTQIKVILQSISDKGAMASGQAQTSSPEPKEPAQAKEPIRAPNYNAPSTEGVSMSRRSVLT